MMKGRPQDREIKSIGTWAGFRHPQFILQYRDINNGIYMYIDSKSLTGVSPPREKVCVAQRHFHKAVTPTQ